MIDIVIVVDAAIVVVVNADVTGDVSDAVVDSVVTDDDVVSTN